MSAFATKISNELEIKTEVATLDVGGLRRICMTLIRELCVPSLSFSSLFYFLSLKRWIKRN